jgi:hypothetical protein
MRRVRLLSALVFLSALLAWISSASAELVLVPKNSVWKYLDNGSNQGTAWRQPEFNDSGWASGAAPLGYGDGDEATVVSFGPDSSAKYITTYFRRAFPVVDPSAFTAVTLRVLRDDGAVVYLNGAEVFRTNMPAGAISSTTPASTAVFGADESTTFYATTVSPSVLRAGTNVLAVEVHQANGTSTDLSFDLELTATDAIAVTRGPYLQSMTPGSVVVRWRTNAPTNSRVAVGASPGSFTSVADLSALTTEHEVTLTGLTPNTTYYYAVGSTTGPLAGGDANHRFVTAPMAGHAKPTRVWVIGDSGTANASAAAVRDAYLAYTGARGTDVWLMLGDNAYQDGTDPEYQAAVFDMYPTLLRQTPLWPTLGNHDGHTANSSTQSGPYYDIFTLPTQAEAGGISSGTEAYYSFDYGNIHFISLESFETDRSPSGPMLTWVRADLALTTQPWIIAFWHHPPYSKGSHDSDVDIELREMRQNALPILEAAGVDLVLSGHSHSYERSFLIDGHYGSSSTLTAAMKKNAGSGRLEGTGGYAKITPVHGAYEGAVYAVAGSSGQASGGALNHPAMFISLNSLGSLVLDIDGNRLDAAFIDASGVRRDYFTLVKGVAGTAPVGPSGLSAGAGSSSQINLAWTDTSGNETGFRIERASAGGAFTAVANVGANVTTFSNTGLAAGTTYQYRVIASNAYGDSPVSNVATATTPASAALPAAPTGLTATAVAKNRINLAWTDNSGNESGFRIERSENGTTFTQIASVGPDVKTYANTGLKANRTYHYRVRAYNAAGNSAYSNTASATTPR